MMKKILLTLIAVPAAAVLLLMACMYIEASMLEVTETDFADGSHNLKVLHISDVHIDFLKVPHEAIMNAVKKEKADIMILTGDYNGRKGHMPQFSEFIRKLSAAAFESGTIKIYACLGNHDYAEYAGHPQGPAELTSILEECGIEMLIDRTTVFVHNGKSYNITGFDDLTHGNPDITLALSGKQAEAQADIAITHNPFIAPYIPEDSVDYLFAGHLHGGQIRLPFGLEMMILQKEIPEMKGMRSGLHVVNGINVYINRGIGNVILPLRFMSKPEISIYLIP